MTADSYLGISLFLFLIWLVTLVFFDRLRYMVFTRGQLRVRVDVHLGQDPLPARVGGEFLQHRAELLARPAPVGPQVDDHRRGPGPLDHVDVKGLLGDVDDGA